MSCTQGRATSIRNACSRSPGLTLRNSTFTNCSTVDASFNRTDYNRLTIANNLFGHSVNGDGWHYYSIWWYTDAFTDIKMVKNTFENGVLMEEPTHTGPGPYSGVWANNVGGGWRCLDGVTYAGNVGTKCGESDVATTPETSCAPPACATAEQQPAGFADPAKGDLRLRADSPAVDAGDPKYAPARDNRGHRRVGPPDAGAFEHEGR